MRNGIKKELQRKIESHTVVGMDTAPLIYYAENHPLYGELSHKIFKFIIVSFKVIITSTLSFGEALSKRSILEDKIAIKRYVILFKEKPYIKAIAPDLAINRSAAELRVRYNLKLPDALQLATAEETHCALFITNDEIFRKVKEKNLDILILKDFIK